MRNEEGRMNKEKSFVVLILHLTFFANPQPCFLDPPTAASLQPNGVSSIRYRQPRHLQNVSWSFSLFDSVTRLRPDFSGDHHRSVDAIQIPIKTATIPTIRLTPTASPIISVAMSEAVIGLTVIVLATRVGVVRSRAYTHRLNAAAPPNAPIERTDSHCTRLKLCVAAKPPLCQATSVLAAEPKPIPAVRKPRRLERAIKGRDQTV